MNTSNFNVLYAIDNSTITNQILRDIKLYISKAKEYGEPLTVNLISDEEMRTLCKTRNRNFQHAILLNRGNVFIDEHSIVPTMRAYATINLSKYKPTQASIPAALPEDNREGSHSWGRGHIKESTLVAPVTKPNRQSDELSTMQVKKDFTTSPGRIIYDEASREITRTAQADIYNALLQNNIPNPHPTQSKPR